VARTSAVDAGRADDDIFERASFSDLASVTDRDGGGGRAAVRRSPGADAARARVGGPLAP
jgi:hypothetical protein